MNWEHAQSIADNFVAQWRSSAPGGGIVVFDEKSIRIQAFGGCANLEFGIPFTAKTVVRMASITKHVTASLVLECADSGILNLDEPIGAYLPSISSELGRVTVRGALDMTGGVPDMIDSAWMLGVPRTALLARNHVLDFLCSLAALNFNPGDEFSYSNAGYRLVEAVLEARGVGLETGIREHLFEPLGVDASLPNDQSDVVANLAPGYWWGTNGWHHGLSGMPYCGADALAVSTAQFVVWLQALLVGRGPTAGLLDRLAASAVLSHGRTTGVGLGIANSEIGGHTFHGFLGGLPGYRSSFLLSPLLKIGVLAVADREDADVGGLCVSLLPTLLGVKTDLPARTEILPDGMFVTTDGPDWLELKQGYATFLGAQSFLYPTCDGHFDSRAFYSLGRRVARKAP